MALTRCADCGHEVSSLAPNCPQCGRPMQKVSSLKTSPCPNCGKQITSLPCAFCGCRESKKGAGASVSPPQQWVIAFGVVLGFCLLIAVPMSMCSNHTAESSPSSNSSPPAEAVSKATSSLEEFRKAGFLMKDQNGYADVDRTWNGFTLDEKRQFALIYHLAHPNQFLLIRDGYSGKILASVDAQGRVDIKTD